MKRNSNISDNAKNGFSLVEVMTAFALFAIVMLGVITSMILSQRIGQSARNRLEALQHSRASLEELVAVSYGHSSLSTGTHTLSRGGLTGRYVVSEVHANQLKRIVLSYDYFTFGKWASVELQGAISDALH